MQAGAGACCATASCFLRLSSVPLTEMMSSADCCDSADDSAAAEGRPFGSSPSAASGSAAASICTTGKSQADLKDRALWDELFGLLWLIKTK